MLRSHLLIRSCDICRFVLLKYAAVAAAAAVWTGEVLILTLLFSTHTLCALVAFVSFVFWILSELSCLVICRGGLRPSALIWLLPTPRVGPGTPFPPLLFPCPFTSSSFALYYLFPFSFLIHFTYFLLLSIRSLSTRIVPLCFQAWGRRRRPNLGLVCLCVMIMLSVLLS